MSQRKYAKKTLSAKDVSLNEITLPSGVPAQVYYSIGDASRYLTVKPYILRYWEKEFEQLTPIKRRGNRRYYTRKDLVLISKIKSLLYSSGFTIEGARIRLKNEALQSKKTSQTAEKTSQVTSQSDGKELIAQVIHELEQLLSKITFAPKKMYV
jgi:DNA-binding transcriptional MerR regulator